MDLRELAADQERLQKLRSSDEWPSVEERLNRAAGRVIQSDWELLEDGRNERAVAHRLAVYIEEEFPGWHVDCEFNRQGDEGRRIHKQVSPALPLLPPSRGSDGARVEPDIVVHKRRTRHNLLVVEVKPSDSNAIERDREKLRKFLSDEHLKYLFAVLVIYKIGSDPSFLPLERIT